MRVKMLNTESGRYAGFTDNGQYHCLMGHEYDVPDKLAKSWVRHGIAKKVKAVEEKAAVKPKTKSKEKRNGN